MNKLTLDENAKQDWLNIVKKHKKKQKGLPALSRLNTNAGNVEKNIELFNKMNSPVESPSNNLISGPFGDSVDLSSEGVAMGESCNTYIKESTMNTEVVELYYSDLELDDAPTGKVIRGNYNTPDEPETRDITIDYTYKTDKDSVIECLQDLPELQEKYWPEDMSSEEFDKFLVDHFDELLEEYEKQVLDYFEEFAVSDALEDWDTSYFEPDWDSMPGGHDDYRFDESKKSDLDDDFDMTMRAIL